MAAELPAGVVLNRAEIRGLIVAERPLVGGCVDLERQLQPNGIDLTLESVWGFAGQGQVGVGDDERMVPERAELRPGQDAYYELTPGSYVVKLNETVDLPRDLMALGRPRSTLLRCGVAIHTAVWDAGYRGRSEALLVVYNPVGFRVRQSARILQLVFLRLSPTTRYSGRFQGENLSP